MQYKRSLQFTKSIDGRTVTGVFAVHGNVDSGNDVSLNGSFARRLTDNGRKRVRFLWQHDGGNPPIAHIDDIREIGRDELPAKVLTWAPDATGGVQVTRTYYENVALADWVLEGIRAGDVDEMSYAYEVHGFEFEERDGRQVRVLKDVELYDVSDVNWGMNPATATVKAGAGGDRLTFSEHCDAVVTTVNEFVARAQERREFRAKEGRVLSGANRTRIKTLLEALDAVTADLRDLLNETEPGKALANADEARALYGRFLYLNAQIDGALS